MAWNAVSKTAIWGIWGCAFWTNSIPAKFAGLCKGAKIESLPISCMTNSLTKTGAWNLSPPWTTRCPIASIWLKSLMIPIFVKLSRIIKSPLAWSLITNFSLSSWSLWCKCDLIFNCPISSPIFSAKPLAKGLFSCMSNNLNLIDELPRFKTKISMHSLLILRLKGANQNGVDNIFHQSAPTQIINGLVQTLQDGPYRHGFSASLHRFISDIPSV